ncbi:MAG: helix-turn-helix transcriptional regulator [Planctomycetales bacterium]|nr:helix-turn-helix transcriptional regulator [Planctomycetales bacterium]
MRYEFRLAELLGHTPDRRKRPGTIKAIVEYTGLDRHQVASLLKNEAKYIPLEALSRLCDYLVEHGYANGDELPGVLFAVKPEHFWEVIARRKKLEICVGVRRPDGEDAPETAWVVASDAVLMGEVLNGVSTLGGTEKFKANSSDQDSGREIQTHPEMLRQTLVWSPSPVDGASEAIERSKEVHKDFVSTSGDKALICLGSLKSNPVVEMLIADVFMVDPFESEDDVERAVDRSCPFFLRYRDTDPHIASASAGVQLSKTEKADQPGIYYEQADGKWVYAGGQDTALVFYVYREPLGRLEMVLSGFSGRATRLLARTLTNRSEEFWPPVYAANDLQIGAFIVQYQEAAQASLPSDILRTDVIGNPTVTAIPVEAIARRIERRASRSNTETNE